MSSSPKEAESASFLGKAGPLVLARLFTAGITISIPLVLARWMELDEYGSYKQVFLLLQALYLILPLGMAQALYYFIPRSKDPRPFFGQTLLFLTGIGLLAGVGLGALMGVVADAFENPELREHRWTSALYLLGLMTSYMLEISLTSRGKTKAAAVCYLVSDVVRAAAMSVPVLLGFGLDGLMVGAAAFAMARFVTAWFVVLRGGTGPLFSASGFKRQLLYALPFGAAMLLAIPQQYAHQFAVSSEVTPALFAIYAVGCFQLPIVDLLYTPTSEVLMVRLGELEKTNRLREGVLAFREAAAKLSLVFLPMAAFLFAAAPEFIGALFGAKFLDAVPIFRISVLGVALAILPMDGVLRARGETRHIFRSYAVKAAVTVPLVYFGVRHFGMMGGISSWAIAELVGKATLLWRVPHALSTPEERQTVLSVIPWRDLGKAFGAAGAAAAGVIALRELATGTLPTLPEGFGWRLVPLALIGLIFAVSYLMALRMTGVRPMAVLASLRRPKVARS